MGEEISSYVGWRTLLADECPNNAACSNASPWRLMAAPRAWIGEGGPCRRISGNEAAGFLDARPLELRHDDRTGAVTSGALVVDAIPFEFVVSHFLSAERAFEQPMSAPVFS
jgi:hypothetical protein